MSAYQKITQVTESLLLFIALSGIILVSALSVMSFNPKLTDNKNSVAGLNTFSDKIKFGLDFKKADARLSINTGEVDDVMKASIRINRLEKGYNEFELATFTNLNEFGNNNMRVESTVNGLAAQDLEIYLVDLFGSRLIYSSEREISTSEIIFGPSEQKDFTLQIHSDEKINFAFELVLEIH